MHAATAGDIFEVSLPDQDESAFSPTADGLPVFHGRSYEDHLEAWIHVSESLQTRNWALAAIAASLVTSYKDETVKRFAYEVRLSRSWIYELADTYRKFENSTRVDNLSFKHHCIAAKAKDPQDAINQANDNEWSTRELNYYVETGFAPAAPAEREKQNWNLQAAARRALAEHIDADALPALLDLKLKCPDTNFAKRFYGNLVRELVEQKADLLIEDKQVVLIAAFEQGFKTDAQLAAQTKMSQLEARQLMKLLAEHGYFTEQEIGWKSDAARGQRAKEWQRTRNPYPAELKPSSE